MAFDQLNAAHNDSDLVEVANYLWQMALRIENGDLSDAERDLRAAEQQLRDALQRNAPEDEIRKLGENLRAAMDKFLQELAAQQNDADRQNEPRARRQKPLDYGQTAASHARQDAGHDAFGRQCERPENAGAICKTSLKICASRSRARPIRRAREMSRALDELGQMSGEQQDLRDETYQNGQAERHRRREERGQLGLPDELTLEDFFGQKDGEEGAEDQAGQERTADKAAAPRPARRPVPAKTATRPRQASTSAPRAA